jgi:hypothetical protein
MVDDACSAAWMDDTRRESLPELIAEPCQERTPGPASVWGRTVAGMLETMELGAMVPIWG